MANIDKIDTKRTWSYPLPEFGGVYVPNVSIIRGSELKGYPFLNKVYKVDVICVAAYSSPQLDSTGKKLHSSLVDNVQNKMRIMLAMAQKNNCQCVVLSASGCGAYKNPVEHIAALFKSVVKEFDGIFEEIVFAIYDDHNAPKDGGNVKPFETEFNTKAIEINWDEE